MNYAALFLSAFATVFLLGFQQQNVQARHYWASAITSLGIGAAQIYLWRSMPGATPAEIAATLAGGPIGIVAAMYSHPRLIRRKS